MHFLEILNGAFCAALAVALLVAILHPRVKDGIVIKAGLCLMVLGFGALALRIVGDPTPTGFTAFERALLLVNGGVAVVMVGYMLRKLRAGHGLRRSSDWAPLDEIPPEAWPKIAGGTDEAT